MKHELRINNYVLYDNRPFQIASISDEYPSLKTIEFGFGVVEWKDISPIPLTEELLVKCGFEKIYESSFRIRYDHPINYIGYDVSKTEPKEHESSLRYYNRHIDCNYLHELQNAFKILTNQELTIEI